MAHQVLESFPFLEEDKKNKGSVDIIRTDYNDRSVVGVRLTVGNKSMPLPRNRLTSIIRALQKGEGAASRAYQQLIEEMNP